MKGNRSGYFPDSSGRKELGGLRNSVLYRVGPRSRVPTPSLGRVSRLVLRLCVVFILLQKPILKP